MVPSAVTPAGVRSIRTSAIPDTTATALKAAVEATRDCTTGAHVTLAVGYSGRQEVIDAIRSLLLTHASEGGTIAELAEVLTTEDISRHLYNVGQPDPDLIIRTSGAAVELSALASDAVRAVLLRHVLAGFQRDRLSTCA
jgi:undecaprenyl diphosphate synthase